MKVITANLNGIRSATNKGFFDWFAKQQADILCLQEVGSHETLQEINRQLERPYSYTRLEQGNSDRGINIATLSRYPFDGLSHKDRQLKTDPENILYEFRDERSSLNQTLSPALFSRDLYLSRFQFGECQLLVFNTHFPSNRASSSIFCWSRLI